MDDVPCFNQLEDAFKEIENDAVLNLTPPQVYARASAGKPSTA
jgi:hypothetical protein